MTPTQNDRVLAFLREHPGATAMDVGLGCHPWVSNPRARFSDLRDAGHIIDCIRRDDGHNGYWLREAPVQSTLFDEVDVAHCFAGPRR